MNFNFQKIKELFLLKGKFFIASILATGLDYLLYFLLYNIFGLPKITSNFISYPIAVLFNFFLQKTFIFSMKRELKTTFGLAMLVSAGGWLMNSGLFYLLMQMPFFQADQWHWAAKLLVNGIIFFYNFYGKRYVFEKKLF